MYREDGERVSVRNEGLTVFLFDESAEGRVQEALDASWAEGSEPERLLDLAASGTLVSYELWQDGPVDVEVALGDPLTVAEKKPAKWMRVIRVPLDLPSGRLRIESGSSLDDRTETEPGLVEVPPGKYELALHRVNWGKMEGRKYEDYDGPGEVLTLRPWPAKKKFKPSSGCIYVGDEPRAPWVGQYEIVEGVFRGQVIGVLQSEGEKRLCINLDMPAYEQLALARGQRLELSAGERSYVVLCQGQMIPLAARWFLGDPRYAALADLHPMLMAGFLSSSGIPAEPRPTEIGEYRDYDFFALTTITNESEAYTSGDRDFDRIFALERGEPVELRAAPDPFFTLDRELPDAWQIGDGELHCKVMSCTPERLYLNVDVASLRRLGVEDGDTLEIELADESRYAFDRRYLGGARHDILERATKDPPAEDLARAEALEKEVYDKFGITVKAVDGWQDRVAEIQRLKIHPDDRLHPPLVVGFEESRDYRDSVMLVLQSAFALGPLSPSAIHIEAEQGDPVVIRRVDGEVVRR